MTLLAALVRRNYQFRLIVGCGSPPRSAHGSTRSSHGGSVTHALSASLVVGAGYIVVRVIDIHSDRIHIPRQLVFVYLFIVVSAFGVIWELFEFGLDTLCRNRGYDAAGPTRAG